MQDAPAPGARYPIRKVTEITGINPVTLRAWERRYGLIKPSRTPKGHRLYSDEHIALIEHILDLVQQGISIGQVKRMLAGQRRPVDTGSVLPAGEMDPWDHYRQRLCRAIAEFDDNGLDAAYNDCLALYPVDLAARFLLRPLLDGLDRETDPLAVNRRSFLYTYLRNKLGARFHHQNVQSHGPLLLGASLSDDTAVLELLLFGLSAMPRGYRFLLLQNAEPETLPQTQAATGAVAMVLFIGRQPLSTGLMKTLRSLVTTRSETPLFLGGRLPERSRVELERIGVVPLGEGPAAAVRRVDTRLHAGNPL